MKTKLHTEFPDTENPYFDPSNGCYHHACGYLTSWFRRTETGWQVTEWASWLSPQWTVDLCDFLATYSGTEIVEFDA